MSTIQFPRNLCDKLDVVIKRFWWNPKSNSGSYLTPMAWSFICWPQKEGDLGLEDHESSTKLSYPKLAGGFFQGRIVHVSMF